ncbi:hypothetical protein GQ55_9G278200 [Panicum hallii var. hallii]|uniref:Knottin scorpion toxin-like domain-containing protein n=1 Tax=Panicum hallii var. hallii TaxID=1504633 RepID=A0A2T7C7H4_9POAL|nr:hypothetical protein GQ55_9G278200 [Panicum hallii var. hallii]
MATFKKNNKVTLVLAAVMIMATLLASSCNARVEPLGGTVKTCYMRTLNGCKSDQCNALCKRLSGNKSSYCDVSGSCCCLGST